MDLQHKVEGTPTLERRLPRRKLVTVAFFIINLKNDSEYACARTHMYHSSGVEARGQPWRPVFSFHHGSSGQTQVAGLGSRYPYLLSPLTSPLSHFILFKCPSSTRCFKKRKTTLLLVSFRFTMKDNHTQQEARGPTDPS